RSRLPPQAQQRQLPNRLPARPTSTNRPAAGSLVRTGALWPAAGSLVRTGAPWPAAAFLVRVGAPQPPLSADAGRSPQPTASRNQPCPYPAARHQSLPTADRSVQLNRCPQPPPEKSLSFPRRNLQAV